MDRTVEEYLSLAEHYKAIGSTKFYMHNDPIPWEKVTGVKPGGLWRSGISISYYFTVEIDGLEFEYAYDIEPHSASGTGGYAIDTAGIRATMAKLPKEVAVRWGEMLAESAVKMREYLQEQQDWYDRQWGKVHFMETAAECVVTA